MSNQAGKPHVKFEVRSLPDRRKEAVNGVYPMTDVDFIIITPAGSQGKFVNEHVYKEWLTKTKVAPGVNGMTDGDSLTALQEARFPWMAQIEAAYAGWKKDEEIPETGFPIKQWAVISPAQREILIGMHIVTVEQLAEATDEATGYIGMGGMTLRQRARDFIAMNTSGIGQTTIAIENLRDENSTLKDRIATLEKTISALTEKQTSEA